MCNACCCTASALFLYVTPITNNLSYSSRLSVSGLHLCHIFCIILLLSLTVSHLSVCAPVFSFFLLCLACFMDCRLKSPGQRNCSACARPSDCYIHHRNSSSKVGKEKQIQAIRFLPQLKSQTIKACYMQRTDKQR